MALHDIHSLVVNVGIHDNYVYVFSYLFKVYKIVWIEHPDRLKDFLNTNVFKLKSSSHILFIPMLCCFKFLSFGWRWFRQVVQVQYHIPLQVGVVKRRRWLPLTRFYQWNMISGSSSHIYLLIYTNRTCYLLVTVLDLAFF